MVGHKTQGGNSVGLCIVGEAQLYTIYKTDCQQFNAISAGLEGFSGGKNCVYSERTFTARGQSRPPELSR